MSVNREFRCMAHGNFESTEESPLCPAAGCDTVQRIFLTPVGMASDRTKGIDKTLRSLAASHGMTDINNRGGRAAKGPTAADNRKQAEFNAFIRERYGDGWGAVPKGGTMNVKTQEIEHGAPGTGAAAALANYHGRADNVLAEVKEAGALVPKPVRVRRDHENLQVSDARPPA